jgi:hypothetical protein
MSTYEPGQPCIATVKGQQGIRVMRSARASTNGLVWASSVAVDGNWWFTEAEVTNVRPLVVLDLDDFAWAAKVLRNPGLGAMDTRARIADQIEQQTKPPRIPEPVGLGAVIEDENGHQWVRMGSGPAPWMLAGASPDNRDTYAWSSLSPARALSVGIEATS